MGPSTTAGSSDTGHGNDLSTAVKDEAGPSATYDLSATSDRQNWVILAGML